MRVVCPFLLLFDGVCLLFVVVVFVVVLVVVVVVRIVVAVVVSVAVGGLLLLVLLWYSTTHEIQPRKCCFCAFCGGRVTQNCAVPRFRLVFYNVFVEKSIWTVGVSRA